MKGAVELQLTEGAQDDLRRHGSLARRLLSTTIRDRVLSPAGVRPLPPEHAEMVDVSGWPSSYLSDEPAPRWFVLDVGDYEIVMRPVVEDGQVTGAHVARVLRKGELNEMLKESPPAVPSEGP
jgi:hypothetical protein